jgi:hypothetical protein
MAGAHATHVIAGAIARSAAIGDVPSRRATFVER